MKYLKMFVKFVDSGIGGLTFSVLGLAVSSFQLADYCSECDPNVFLHSGLWGYCLFWLICSLDDLFLKSK